MKKNKNALLLLALSLLLIGCKKHVIEYDTKNVTDAAEFQLHYFVPIAAVDSNSIFKFVVNEIEYVNGTMNSEGVFNPSVMLSTYNAAPSGSVGRFYTTTIGNNNIKMFAGKNFRPVYDQNVSLSKGKQNIFVYDFNKPPIVFDNGFPYPKIVTENSGTTSWVKFYNFLYETATIPTSLKLQYQYQYTLDVVTKEKSEWINVGKPLGFGEATGWEPVTVIKEVEISAGTARLDYRIRLIGTDGSDVGSLKIINASNNFVDYSDWWNAAVGRCYHHVLSGIRTSAPRTAVRVFTAL